MERIVETMSCSECNKSHPQSHYNKCQVLDHKSPMFILTCIKTLHQSQVLKEDATELQLGYNENLSLKAQVSIGLNLTIANIQYT